MWRTGWNAIGGSGKRDSSVWTIICENCKVRSIDMAQKGNLAARDNAGSKRSEREIVVSRIFDAPRELIFDAWTDPQHIGRWWGPRGFTTTTAEMDVRPGGVWRFVMHGPNGVDYQNKVVYVEVVPPERLVYNHSSGEEDDSGEFKVTVTFAAQGDKTELTMRALFKSAAERDRVVKEFGAIDGAHQTLDRLAEYLSKP
jgi:uncharacterized protein YndB with AHSA1/START domain